MKYLVLSLAIIVSTSTYASTFNLKSSVMDEVEFVSHETPGQWTSYLVMNINFPPVKELFESLDEFLAGTLNTENARTEAHITVITPVEFHNVLREKITIEEIHELARDMGIQEAKFEVGCLGKGEAKVSDRLEQTYYLVVKSDRLLEIRKSIFNLFKSRGGNISQFDPNLFYPHITIGYTSTDLHLESNGVKKGTNSCFAEIILN